MDDEDDYDDNKYYCYPRWEAYYDPYLQDPDPALEKVVIKRQCIIESKNGHLFKIITENNISKWYIRSSDFFGWEFRGVLSEKQLKEWLEKIGEYDFFNLMEPVKL